MGKSRYGSLVKLKKKSMDEAERALIAANNEVAFASDRLNTAYETLSTLSLPSHGSIQQLTQANLMIQAQHTTIEECKEILERTQREQQERREQFERARIDYEKFNYLEIEEIKERIKKIKGQEAKMLDEIGVMSFKREPQ